MKTWFNSRTAPLAARTIGTLTAVHTVHYKLFEARVLILTLNSLESDISDTSSLASDDLTGESLYERLAALQDILPPSQRKFLHNTVDSSSAWLKTGLAFSGKALWIISTSALLAVVPWALAYAEDQQMAEMEREMKMQQSASEVSSLR
jgi:hypothetical protein